jgi:hypothetical protein
MTVTVGSGVTMDTRTYFKGRKIQSIPDLTALCDYFGREFEISWLTTLESLAQLPGEKTTQAELEAFAARYHEAVCDNIGSDAHTSWGHPVVDALVRLLFPAFTCSIDPEENR